VSVGRLTGDSGSLVRTATWLFRAIVLVVVGIECFTGSTAHGAALTVQGICFGVGAALVLAWGFVARRRPPHAAAGLLPWGFALMAACSAPTTATDGGALIAFGFIASLGAGSESSLAAGWIVTATGVLAIVIGGLVDGASATAILGYSALMVIALLAGHNRRSYRVEAEHTAALLEQSEQLRAEQRQVAILDERNRIAREIHDVLAHSLSALSIQIQTARALLSDQHDVDRSLKVLDAAQRMATDGLTETRRAVHALRTDTQSLSEELRSLAEGQRSQSHAAIHLDITGTSRPLTPDAELALLRTAQESFVNAAKHSGGQPVDACLNFTETQTTLTITNPLVALAAPAKTIGTTDGGYGLIGMRERLLLLGGSLTAGPDADQWRVTAVVPQ
jgi:signal transduction histidine kinase